MRWLLNDKYMRRFTVGDMDITMIVSSVSEGAENRFVEIWCSQKYYIAWGTVEQFTVDNLVRKGFSPPEGLMVRVADELSILETQQNT